MTKKEQYLIIVYGIAFAILAAITISVWFDTDKAIPGLNYPPMHHNCRSTTAIALDTQTKQGLTRIARNLDTGQTYLVPADLKYKDWKKQQGIS